MVSEAKLEKGGVCVCSVQEKGRRFASSAEGCLCCWVKRQIAWVLGYFYKCSQLVIPGVGKSTLL